MRRTTSATRIDTALAHYKTLGDQMAQSASAAAAKASAPAAADALTNADVISMVAAKLDEANIIDTIQHSSAVSFDLSAGRQRPFYAKYYARAKPCRV